MVCWKFLQSRNAHCGIAVDGCASRERGLKIKRPRFDLRRREKFRESGLTIRRQQTNHAKGHDEFDQRESAQRRGGCVRDARCAARAAVLAAHCRTPSLFKSLLALQNLFARPVIAQADLAERQKLLLVLPMLVISYFVFIGNFAFSKQRPSKSPLSNDHLNRRPISPGIFCQIEGRGSGGKYKSGQRTARRCARPR